MTQPANGQQIRTLAETEATVAESLAAAPPEDPRFDGVDGPKHDTRAKQERFLRAFGELGELTSSAKAAGISRASHYIWLENDTLGYRERFAYAKETHDDRLERKLYNLVDGLQPHHNPTALIFALNGAKPEKYKTNIHVRDDTARETLREIRNMIRGGRRGPAVEVEEVVNGESRELPPATPRQQVQRVIDSQ